VSNPPGAVTAAFWVAQQALSGKKMPKDIQVPLLEVKQEDLDAALAKVQPGGVSDILYSVDETVKIVDKE
jgi:ribose transport system substrate-binding protein